VRLGLLSLFLLGCGPAAYQPRGVIQHNDVDPRTLHRAGCLEVAFGVHAPIRADDAALLVVRVGNTCLKPAPFDLKSVGFYTLDSTGQKVQLTLADPRDELMPMHIDAGAKGIEKVRLEGPLDVSTVCIDLQTVAPFCLPVPS
jgi:hypothetical protein